MASLLASRGVSQLRGVERPRRQCAAQACLSSSLRLGGPRTATSPLWAPQPAPWTHTPSRQHGHDRSILVAAAEKEAPVKYNKEFGYSRKDIIIITFGLIALGYLMYYGLQALGMEAGMAGNWVQMIIFLGICVGYISTYLFRVATKQMTYVKQLEAYEEAVMQKRIEEMTEDELQELMAETEEEKARRAARRAAFQAKQQQEQSTKQ